MFASSSEPSEPAEHFVVPTKYHATCRSGNQSWFGAFAFKGTWVPKVPCEKRGRVPRSTFPWRCWEPSTPNIWAYKGVKRGIGHWGPGSGHFPSEGTCSAPCHLVEPDSRGLNKTSRIRVVGSFGVYPTTSVILLGIPSLCGLLLWEALFVASQIRGFHFSQPGG